MSDTDSVLAKECHLRRQLIFEIHSGLPIPDLNKCLGFTSHPDAGWRMNCSHCVTLGLSSPCAIFTVTYRNKTSVSLQKEFLWGFYWANVVSIENSNSSVTLPHAAGCQTGSDAGNAMMQGLCETEQIWAQQHPRCLMVTTWNFSPLLPM